MYPVNSFSQLSVRGGGAAETSGIGTYGSGDSESDDTDSFGDGFGDRVHQFLFT